MALDVIKPDTMTIDEGAVTPLVELWVEFGLTPQEVAGEAQLSTALTLATRTFGLSLSGAGNIVDGNVISGNAVGIAVRPAADMTMAWISRNAIYGNGQKIERCFAGGSCDPDLRKGGIVFGLPSGEHERYVGKRGIGVAPAPGSLAKICPDGAPTSKRRRMAVSPPPRSSARARAQTGSPCKAPYEAIRCRVSPSKCSAIGRRAVAKAKYFSAML